MTVTFDALTFTIVPDWVLESLGTTATGRTALAVYCEMSRIADYKPRQEDTEVCFSMAKLADRLDVNRATIKRALNALRAAHAVSWVERRDPVDKTQLAHSYTVHRIPPAATEPAATPTHTRTPPGASVHLPPHAPVHTPPYAPVREQTIEGLRVVASLGSFEEPLDGFDEDAIATHTKNAPNERRTRKQTQPHAAVIEAGTVTPGTALEPHRNTPTTTTARPRDEIWDAVCDALGADPTNIAKANRSRYGRVVRDLKENGATPRDIAIRSEVYRRTWPGMTLTPEALLKHWDQLTPNEHTARIAQGGPTHAERLARTARQLATRNPQP